jgi:protein-tyrosine-phosphatase/DNA-binding transcriptional ArsR family regulator
MFETTSRPTTRAGSLSRRLPEPDDRQTTLQKLTQSILSRYRCSMNEDTVETRASRHAALSDSVRLAIVDELVLSDRAPVELRTHLGIESNLLAHHLDVLESVGMINRSKSSGDGRRRYVHLLRKSLVGLTPGRRVSPGRALFVCTRNSARSQLAAALWRSIAGFPAESAGTDPADRVHPGAIAAAARAGLDLTEATPRRLDRVGRLPRLVVTVCDQAHEEIAPDDTWLHWSIPDPVATGTRRAFDSALAELAERITMFVADSAGVS